MNHKGWCVAGAPAMPQVMGTDDCCVAYYAFRPLSNDAEVPIMIKKSYLSGLQNPNSKYLSESIK